MLTSGPTNQLRKRILGSALAGLLVLGACGGDDGESGNGEETTDTTEAETPELAPDTSFVATAKQNVTEVAVYAEPDGEELGTVPNPFKVDETNPDISSPATFLVQAAEGEDPRGEEWLHVMTPLPMEPDNAGYVRADDVDVTMHNYRITVDLDAFNLALTHEGEEVFNFPVGLGRDDRATSPGNYFTTQLIASTNDAYGPYAFGVSSFPTDPGIIADFGEDASVGIHGTNDPAAIGTNVSSGCIRLHNENITQMAEGIGLPNGDEGLPLGVPVDVVA